MWIQNIHGRNEYLEEVKQSHLIMGPHLCELLSSSSPEESKPLGKSRAVRKLQITQHSRLNQPVAEQIVPDNPKELVALLAQIHADALLHASSFHSPSTHVGLGSFIKALQTTQAVQLPEKLIEKLLQLQKVSERIADLSLSKQPDPAALSTYAQELMQLVYNLTIGESFLIEGGRIDPESGRAHPVLFEFIKQSAHSYDLSVYLPSHEPNQFLTTLQESDPGDAQQNGTEWRRPIVRYKNIPEEKLFFNDKTYPIQADFFQSIIETRVIRDKKITPRYVAFGLLLHLQSHREKPEEETSAFSASPHSATDLWQLFKSFLKPHLSKENYDKLILEIKMRSLVESYQKLQTSLAEVSKTAEQLRTLFGWAVRGLLKRLLRAKSTHLVEEGLLKSYEMTLLDLKEQLQRSQEQTRAKELQVITSLKEEDLVTDTKQGQRAETVAELTKNYKWPKSKSHAVIGSAPLWPLLSAPEELANHLEKWLAQIASQPPQLQLLEIESLVAQFEIPKKPRKMSYWEQVKHPLDLVRALQQLLAIYDKALGADHPLGVKEANTVYSLYVILHTLSLRLDKENHSRQGRDKASLSNYPLYFPGMENEKNVYALCLSPQEFERREALFNYFRETHLQNPNLGYELDLSSGVRFGQMNFIKKGCVPPPFCDFLKSETLTKESCQTNSLFSFLAALADAHPQLAKGTSPEQRVVFLFQELSKSYDPKTQKKSIFFQENLDYIPALLYSAFLSHQVSHGYSGVRKVPGDKLFHIRVVADGLNKWRVQYERNLLLLQQDKVVFSSQLHPTLSSGYRQLIEKQEYAPYNSPIETGNPSLKEGSLLSEAKQIQRQSKLPQAPSLLSYISASTLTLPKLISHYKNNLTDLANSEEQTLFELFFFRTVAYRSLTQETQKSQELRLGLEERWTPYLYQHVLPLQQESKQAPFREACRALISSGIEQFSTLQPGQRPHVWGLLFFIRLNATLAAFLPDGQPLVKLAPLLQQLLVRSDLTAEERSALSLHLIVAMQAEEKPLSQETLQRLLSAWVYYKNTPLSDSWRRPLLEKEAQGILYRAVASCLSQCDLEFYRNALQSALTQMGFPALPENCPLTFSPPCVKAMVDESHFYEFNLLTGELANEQGVVKKVSKPYCMNYEKKKKKERTEDDHCRALFHGRSHSYFQTQETIYFQDPVWGPCRIIKQPLSTGLQRHVQGCWYGYLSASVFVENQVLPMGLLKGHVHWLALEGPPEILISNKHGQLVGRIKASGEIIEEASGALLYSPAENSSLARVSSHSGILITRYKENACKLTLSNYRSENGEPVGFELTGSQAIYTNNKKYILSLLQKEGLLGGIKNYLVLEQQKSQKKKLLIPLRPIKRGEPLTGHHQLKIENRSGILLEYDLEEEKIKPLTQEGLLYLAYLALTQRDYVTATGWLRQISPLAVLSQKSRKVLMWIVKLVKHSDLSPDGAAVGLLSYHLFCQEKQRARIEGREIGGELKLPTELLHVYKRHRASLPVSIRLRQEEEKLLLANLYVSTTNLHQYGIETTERYNPIQYPLHIHHQRQLPFPGAGFLQNMGSLDAENNSIYVRGIAASFFPKSKVRRHAYFQPQLLTQARLAKEDFFADAFQITFLDSPGQRSQLYFRLQLIYERGQLSESEGLCWSYLYFALSHRLSKHEIQFPTSLEEDAQCWRFIQYMEKEITYFQNAESRLPKLGVYNQMSSPHSTTEFIPPPLPLPPQPLTNNALLTLTPLHNYPENARQLSRLFENHFKPLPPQLPKERENYAPHMRVDGALSEDEKHSQQAIEADLIAFRKDYEAGRRKNDKSLLYELDSVEGLKKEIQETLCYQTKALEELETAILELANQVPDDLDSSLRRENQLDCTLTLGELILLFLRGETKRYVEANAYLQHLDQGLSISRLHNLIGTYLILKRDHQRFKRIDTLCKKSLVAKDHATCNAYVQQLATECDSSRWAHYIPAEQPAFLVFEVLSEKALRPRQAKLLKELLTMDPKKTTYRNRVIQEMMGGGKTTVLAVILLTLAARDGRLSIFVTPATQYSSVSYNLDLLRRYFGRHLETLDFQREELTLERCCDIEKRLQAVIEKNNFLLMKPETLQCLELEFLDLVYKAAKSSFVSRERLEHINTLRRILLIFREKGDVLIDEVDLVLKVLQEVNFPTGEEIQLSAERVELVRQIFLLLVSNELIIDEAGTSICPKRLVRLQENKQSLLSMNCFHGAIAQGIARTLAREHEALKLKLHPELHASFYRYISGKIAAVCQQMLDQPQNPLYTNWEADLSQEERCDFEFLSYLKQLRSSFNKEEQEAAQQIALVKQLMLDVLPVTLSKEVNKNVGRRKDAEGEESGGDVCHYDGPDAPNDTRIGSQWENVAYHFQIALSQGIKATQLKHLVQLYQTQAGRYAEKEKRSIDTTLEAREFKELTGVDLFTITQPGNLDKAIAHLNHHVTSLLKLEADTALECVTYHPYRLRSTGPRLLSMFSSVRTMSGTPWNECCYGQELRGSFLPAWGTEGRIADMLLCRATLKEKKHVHLLQSDKLEEVIEELFKDHPEKERLQILLDLGGLLKESSNFEVAKALRNYLKKPVLFFIRHPHKKNGKKEKKPDTLALLKLDSDIPVIIGGTSLESIEKTGLDANDYFVYADARHTTGTDIPLKPNAIGLMTVDEKVLQRDIFQTMLRLRDYFSFQELEWVIPNYLLKELPETAVTTEPVKYLLGCLMLGLKNQALTKAKEFFRSRKQAIDNLFDQELLRHRLLPQELSHREIKTHCALFEPLSLLPQTDAPYEESGPISYPLDSVERLEAYAQQKLQTFAQRGADPALVIDLETEIAHLLGEAKCSPYLPSKIIDSMNTTSNTEVELMSEMQQETNQQTQVQIEQDLLKELQIYQQESMDGLRPEDSWPDTHFEALINQLLAGENRFHLSFLKKKARRQAEENHLFEILCLSETVEKGYAYQHNFSDLFRQEILTTYSWSFTTKNSLSVFHPLQRAADHLLILHVGNHYKVLLLAQSEAVQMRAFLHRNYLKKPQLKDVWLVQSNGELFEENPYTLTLPSHPEIEELLLHCNAFNGKIDYLDSHPEVTYQWLHQPTSLPEGFERKCHFLKLKIAHSENQKKIFFGSPLFSLEPSLQAKKRARTLYEKYQQLDEPSLHKLTEKDQDILGLLAPASLNRLLPTQVNGLPGYQFGNLSEAPLIQAVEEKYKSHLLPSQMHKIGAHQVTWFAESREHTEKIPIGFLKAMTEKQREWISGKQIRQIRDVQDMRLLEDSQWAEVSGTQVQLGLVPEEKIALLRRRSALQTLSVDQLRHVSASLRQKHLIKEQVEQLDPLVHQEIFRELTAKQALWVTDPTKTEQLPDPLKEEVAKQKALGHTVALQEQAIQVDSQAPQGNVITLNTSNDIHTQPEIDPSTQSSQNHPVPSGLFSVARRIALCVGLLLSLAALCIGVCALVGYSCFAPQFCIDLAEWLKSPVTATLLTIIGSLLFVGLTSYALYRIIHARSH